jgi:membrane-bound serine protease (ClpP class)
MRLRIFAVFTGLLMLAAECARANLVESAVKSEVGVRDWILSSIRDPNIALALMFIGALGIYAECIRPGRVLPGVAGGISLLLGLSAIRFLPINWLGAVAIMLAFLFLILEVKFAAHGVLGVAGAAALVIGARVLVAGGTAESHIHWSTAIGLGLPFSGVTLYLLTIAARARRNKRETAI